MVSCFWDQDWIPVKHSSVINEFNKSSNSYYIPVCCLFLCTHCYHNLDWYRSTTTIALGGKLGFHWKLYWGLEPGLYTLEEPGLDEAVLQCSEVKWLPQLKAFLTLRRAAPRRNQYVPNRERFWPCCLHTTDHIARAPGQHHSTAIMATHYWLGYVKYK